MGWDIWFYYKCDGHHDECFLPLLSGNEISQVDGLEGLSRLRELVLDRNRIKMLGENSFISQTGLLELRLSENRIRELNHLHSLTELSRLFLDMNKLQVQYLLQLPQWICVSYVLSFSLAPP